MTDQSTMDRLHVMKLTKMAENYLLQEQDPRIKEMSFDERFALMVDAEYRAAVSTTAELATVRQLNLNSLMLVLRKSTTRQGVR